MTTDRTIWTWTKAILGWTFRFLLVMAWAWAMLRTDWIDRPDDPVDVVLRPLRESWPVLLAIFAAGGLWSLAELRLRGTPLLAVRCGFLGLAAFCVLVVSPALGVSEPDELRFGPEAFTGLAVWLGMVVPAIGVLIAYKMIGDGRPKAARTEQAS